MENDKQMTQTTQCPLSKNNFDLENITYRSETTIEHDDSEYDHWEVTMFLPKYLTSEQVPLVIEQILRNQEIVKELNHLIRDMDTGGTVSKVWVKEILQRISQYGIRAK